MSIKIPAIPKSNDRKDADKKPDDRKDVDLILFHQELVNSLNPQLEERRRLIKELETIKKKDPNNIELISSIENQISDVSDQIREEIKDIKAKKPNEWKKAKSEVKEKRILEKINTVLLLIKNKSPEEILDITLKLIEEGSISVVLRGSDSLIKPLDKNGQLRIAMKMIEEGEYEKLIDKIHLFQLLNSKEGFNEIFLACVNARYSIHVLLDFIKKSQIKTFYFSLEQGTLFDMFRKLLPGENKESQMQIALELIKLDYFYAVSNYIHLFDKIKDSESIAIILIELIKKSSTEQETENIRKKFVKELFDMGIIKSIIQRETGAFIINYSEIFIKGTHQFTLAKVLIENE